MPQLIIGAGFQTSLFYLAPCCVFYVASHQIYLKSDSDDMIFASTLIWYHTHRQTHRRGRDQ